MTKKLGLFQKFGYGLGNLGYSAVSQTMSTLIMFFGTSVAGIPGTLVGLCIAIGTVWDAVTDPIVGFFSDNTPPSNLGKRQKYILIASLFMALSNLLLWSLPLSFSNGEKFVWLLVSLLIYETADTFFATPYCALGYEMTNDSDDATSLQAVKSVFYLIGMILPSFLMYLFMNDNTTKAGYLKIGICTSLMILITTVLCIISINRNEKKKVIFDFPIVKKRKSILHAFVIFFEFLKDKNHLYIIIGYSVSTIATAILTSLGMHVFTFSFHFSSSRISVLLMLLMVGAMVSQIFITKISTKIGKIETLIKFIIITIMGIGLIAVVFTLRTIIPSNINYFICIPLIMICGVGSGALYSLPFAVFSDMIAQENKMSGINQTGTLSGIMTFVFKISNAVSLFVIGVILDIIQFNSNEPVQPLIVQNSLGAVMLFGVSISLTFAIVFFSKYKNK